MFRKFILLWVVTQIITAFPNNPINKFLNIPFTLSSFTGSQLKELNSIFEHDFFNLKIKKRTFILNTWIFFFISNIKCGSIQIRNAFELSRYKKPAQCWFEIINSPNGFTIYLLIWHSFISKQKRTFHLQVKYISLENLPWKLNFTKKELLKLLENK